MLAYLRYLSLTYISQELNSIPTHGIYQLLTSEHLETFHAAFANVVDSAEEEDLGSYFRAGDTNGKQQIAAKAASITTSDSSTSSVSAKSQSPTSCRTSSEGKTMPREEFSPSGEAIPGSYVLANQCNSPTRSDEGYGSYSGDSAIGHTPENNQDGDETAEEIAALGIIEECDELPDYGVALSPARCQSISPRKQQRSPRRTASGSDKAETLSPRASPTRQRLAELSGPTPKQRRIPSSRADMSENAKNLLSMGYALSLIGEKFEKSRSIEGSVKSVILKAGQAIEKSQNGSVYGKSRYGGSRYGGSRYGGSKYGGSRFGGSKRSVARSAVLEETLPDWGF